MHSNPLIVLSAIMAASVANAGHGKGGWGGCGSDFDDAWSTITDYPTPDDSLKSFLSEQTLWSQWSTITDSCAIPAVTGSLAGEYTSWVNSYYRWQSEHEDEISDIWGSCTDSPYTKDGWGYGYFRPDITDICTSVTWLNAATATPTSGSSSADTESDESDNDNAAPHDTGMAFTAMIMASVIIGVIII